MVPAGDCLAVRLDRSDEIVVPIFAKNDSRPEKLVLGERVALGGGIVDRHPEPELPPECDGAESYFIVVVE